jgi:predicted enzyme related to lactoylglutathione lyase
MVRLPGSMSWHDLMTRDTLAAKDFYASVFGWQFTVMDPAGDYSTVFGDSPSGMICAVGAMDAGVPEQVPAHWRVYFSVTGTDDAVERVRAGGGSVQSEPWDTPYGRMSQVSDPQGATFVLIDHSTAQMPA